MNTRSKLVKYVGALVCGMVVLTGCTTGGTSKAQSQGQKVTEQAFEQQSSAVPYPAAELKDSLERRNLKARLLRTNNPDALGYVYLMNFGKIVGYYAVKGKVSSNQSQMTTDQLIVKPCDSCDRYVVNAPGDDGSYGPNESGIFFFTTEGVMVTTSLDYIWSDDPLPVDVPRLNSRK